MRRGVVISGAGHGALILLGIFGLPDTRVESAVAPAQVSDVSIITLEEFQAAISDAPRDLTGEVPTLSTPTEDALDAPDAVSDPKLDLETVDAPDAPDTETAPDASGLAVTNPDVAVDLDIPVAEIDAGSVGIDTPLLNAAPRDGSINSTQTAMVAPPRPNLAPRIDTSAAPKPKEDAKEASEATEATAPEPSTAPPQEQAEEAAPKEATTEITPDAVKQDRPTTPAAAARPKGRPKVVPKPKETKTAAKPEEKPAASPVEQPAAQATTAGARLGKDFNSSERQVLGDVIGGFWNKAPILGKEGFERLVVVVRVRLNADGTPLGGVEPVDPANPTGDFKVAFRQARTAVMRAAAKGLPLPKDKFRDGDYLEIRFDPGREAISLQ